MSPDDKHGKDGLPKDDVSSYPADAQRLQSYVRAEQQLSQFQAPVFIHADNPHERLYVACLDGTGNDESKPQFGPKTNVARIYDQVNTAHNDRIQPGYVPGPGTQDGWWVRTRDGVTGRTYDERVEEAYKQLIDQVKEWRREDPLAEIRVVGVGFSRGADQEAGLARLIQERAIQDPSGAIYTRDRNNQITHVEYTKPPLVAPGKVAQAELLFDAVGTGVPEKHDRRPPPSVISGFQIIAADERRSKFKSDHIVDPGMTPDGRFLGVVVAGAHSDIGGSYKLDGLGIRSENLAINYLNALSDTPFLATQPLPDDPRMNVVHRSERAFPFDLMGTVDRVKPEGYNELLVPKREAAHLRDPYNAEPRDESLSLQFERQGVRTGVQPMALDSSKDVPANDLSTRLDRLLAAGQANDWNTFSLENQTLAYGDAGRSMLTCAAANAGRLEQQAAQQMAQQQAMPPPMQQAMQGPVMRH